jgi:hypothetical protein
VVDPRSGGPGTVVTVASGTDPCVPSTGTIDPTVRLWIAAPDGTLLHEVTLPVASDGSWAGTMTIPESAGALEFVDLLASCAGNAEVSTNALGPPYHLYSAVRLTITTAPSTPNVPSTPTAPPAPAEPASAVPSSPTFVG